MNALSRLRLLMQGARVKVALFVSHLPGSAGPKAIAWCIEAPLGRWLVPGTLVVRRRYEMTRAFDPLADGKESPAIEVFIPCVPKDLPTLRLAIEGAMSGSRNLISGVTVCTPKRHAEEVEAVVGSMARVLVEDDLRLPVAMAEARRCVPDGRRNWVVQQLLKFGFVAQSSAAGVLVVDADTVLLRSRTWLADGSQLLAVSTEMHSPYRDHVRSTLGDTAAETNVSFVTHHQLMQPDVVRSMLARTCVRRDRLEAGSAVDIDHALAAWLSAADFTQGSPLSEYHSYGAWLLATQSRGTVIGSWSNVSARYSTAEGAVPDLDVTALRLRYPDASSVSFHSYLLEQ